MRDDAKPCLKMLPENESYVNVLIMTEKRNSLYATEVVIFPNIAWMKKWKIKEIVTKKNLKVNPFFFNTPIKP